MCDYNGLIDYYNGTNPLKILSLRSHTLFFREQTQLLEFVSEKLAMYTFDLGLFTCTLFTGFKLDFYELTLMTNSDKFIANF